MGFRSKLLATCGGAPIDPNFRNVTLLLHGNGSNGAQNNTFLDSSSNNFTITRNGNTTQGSFSPYGSVWSNYFDNTGDYLSIAANAALSFGTGAFTLEAWVYNTTGWSTDPIFESRSSGGSSGGYAFLVNSSGYLNVYQAGSFLGNSTTALATNTWYHVALVRSGTGTNQTTYYINGVASGTITLSANLTDGSSNETKIGGSTTAGENWGGYISNARIVKGTAVYTSNFTPPTAPLTAISGTSLLTCQSNRFRDASSNNFAITRNGDVKVTNFAPFAPSAAYSAAANGGSAYFDGSGDNITIARNSAFIPTTGDFTVEAWIYPNSVSSTQIIAGLIDAGVAGDWRMAIVSGQLVFWAGTDIFYGTIVPGAWNHVMCCRSGSTLYIGINGTASSQSNSSSLNNGTSYPLSIGGDYDANGALFSGFISDFRVVNGSAVYASTSYAVPTAPITAVTNTAVLTRFQNAAIFDNSAKNDLETVGNAQISTSVKKFGTGSISLNGTTDYLRTYSRDLLSFGTGDFTIEAWVYPTSVASIYGTLIEARSAPLAQSYACGLRNSGGVYKVEMYTGTQYLGSTTVSLNTWTHVAITRANGTLRIFVNGVLDTAWAGATEPVNANGAAQLIGVLTDGAGTYFPGYLDDLRITKGVARYTANFTPPAAAFPDQ